SLIAERERDPRRARILNEMAAGELGHRHRLEARLTELGIPIPDPGTIRVPRWTRLQARIAPVEKLLAAREAAEDWEVTDLYRRPTGDEATDQLLTEIREEEDSHSEAVSRLRLEGSASPSPAQHRLNRILGREKWHQLGSGWISGAIYGANDGLAAVFGIVSGVSGATGGSHFVLTAGMAGAVASALSMATGAFLAERSEAEVAHANVERERAEIASQPDEEREEVSLFYQLKGLDKAYADELAAHLSKDPATMLQVQVTEELGGASSGGSPAQAALAAGLSTGLGALVPVIPFFFLTGAPAVIAAAIVSLLAHFLVGAAKSLVTLRTWWAAGLEMTAAGVIVGGATFAGGILFKL
ncbi:MAG TPA: VIT1/CCC1 transporter family protein, partial [Candidatus Dormibacteraeota bacterium]|nr:VIT1/CCC1 transporter family protein [Candidatus Dormibacteraeota bacterium]